MSELKLTRIVVGSPLVMRLVLASLLLSRLAFAQAEPAPPEYVPPGQRQAGTHPDPPRVTTRIDNPWTVAVHPRLNFRLGDAPSGVPFVGFGGGVDLSRAIVQVSRVRIGLMAAFSYDRFQREEQSTSHAAFSLELVLDGWIDRVRPWVSVGGGFTVGAYQGRGVVGVTQARAVDVAGLVAANLGVQVRITGSFLLGLRGYMHPTFSSVTAENTMMRVFAPGYGGLALDLGFRF